MSGTVGNIIARVGADISPLTEDMKKAQNTILTFKDESLAALKSFGLPHISSTNLVESIQSGQRVIVNFAQESGETLVQFQQRVRLTFQEAGIDIMAYETILQDANKVHAEFTKGAVKNFQVVSAAAEEANNKAQELQSSIGKSVTGLSANFSAFKDSVSNAFRTMGDDGASFSSKLGAVGQTVVDGFGLMTGALEIFIAVEIVKKVGEWISELKELAAEVEDVQHRFIASTGVMSNEATEFSETLSKSLGVGLAQIKNEMGTEYLNSRMLGFNPEEAESMAENLTTLSYNLGKLRGEDPSVVFDKLKTGVMGQTRGLSELGIRITETDLKNQALNEGLIKQGGTLTDQQKSLLIYQDIMRSTAGVQGYYATTTNDVSTQSTKLNAGWQEMKETMANALTPAFVGFYKVLNWVAVGIETLSDGVATAIQYISLFAEDAYSAINDVMAMNFGQINQDWDNNASSIFDASAAAKQYGAALDGATSAANAQNAAADAQNQAAKNLGKSVNANTMSFDELHNITDSGTTAAQGQTAAVNNLAEAMAKLNDNGMGDIKTESKGIVIPIHFKVPPIPPIPPIPPQPPVVFPALDLISPVVATIQTELGALPKLINVPLGLFDQTEPIYGQVRTKLETFAPKLINVPVSVIGEALLTTALLNIKTKLLGWQLDAISCFDAVTKKASEWETSAVKSFGNVKTAISGWQTDAVIAFGLFATALALEFSTGFKSAGNSVHTWQTSASTDFSSFATNANKAMSTFSTQFKTAWEQTLSATEIMVDTWATRVEQAFSNAVGSAMSSIASLATAAGQTLSNVGNSVGNWANNNKTILAGAALAGVTVATGGADLVVGGIASAGAALASIGAGFGAAALAGIGAMATGGVVTSPQVKLIGEAGPEAVIPLDRLDSMLTGASNSTGNNNSDASSSRTINVSLQLDGRTLARTLYSYNVNETDRQGTTLGYNSSYNLPK